MRRSFAARRIPRKIGQDNDDDARLGSTRIQEAEGRELNEPVLKRPILSSRPKKKSTLRLSFGPGEDGGEDGDEEGTASTFTPKKSTLSRLAMEKNADRKSRASLLSDRLSTRAGPIENRPSYSKEYISELKASTPSTPKTTGMRDSTDEDEGIMKLDIAAKFGPLATLSSGSSVIPTEAEIQEKKARRARLAKEKAYISLGVDNDDDDDELPISDDEFVPQRDMSLRQKDQSPETRLVHDDEDIAEGFEEFVEDGKISLGRKAEREAEHKRRVEIASLIAEAEGSDDGDTDDSEAERRAAYEAAQTKAGTYSSRRFEGSEIRRPRTPPRITPLPELNAVLERLRSSLREKEEAKTIKVKKLEDLRAEKIEIAEREVWIQTQLKETGEKYEKLRIEAGLGGGVGTPMNDDGGRLFVQRGLESLGATPIAALSEASDL